MDFYKAISILGLNPNFTEAEFKTAYRKLSQEYHPDKFEGTNLYELMQKKQQEINSAREFIKRQLKTNPKANLFSISDYLNYKKKELGKIINFGQLKIQNKDYIITMNLIREDIDKFEMEISKIYILKLTKEDIDEAYSECIENIKSKFLNLKNLFYQKNGINKEIVKEQINYNCTLNEFYLQLEKIEEKYGKTSQIKRYILIEIQKYQYFAGYEKLKTLIDKTLINTLNEIKEDNFQNIKMHIEKMHKEITEIFQTYHIQSQIIKELEQVVYATKNRIIINDYEKLKNSFQNVISLKQTKKEIEKLKKKIEKHQIKIKKTEEYKQNEEKINKIYNDLLDRYNVVIKKYNDITDYKTRENLNEFLNQVLKIFSKGCKEKKSIDFFENLNQITFTNMEKDNLIIEKSIECLKERKINVYIKKTFDYPAYYYLDEENMIIYKESYGMVTSKKITEEELEKEYVEIEKILEKAIYVGDRKKIYKTLFAEILYETENLIIYTQANKVRIVAKEDLSDSITLKEKDETLEIFKDKYYLFEMLENQMISAIEKYKQQSTNSNIHDKEEYDDYDNKRKR